MADDIVIKCQKCGHKMRTSAKFIGKKGNCTSCGAVIRLQQAGAGHVDGTESQIVSLDKLQSRKDAMLSVTKQDEVAVVTFVTSRILDQSNVQQLGEELTALVDEFGLKRIVLDFSNVNYMSSAVMGKLVGLLKKVKAADGKIALCCIEESILEIFKIMRFDKMFSIYKTNEKAVSKLS
jgi:anti-sigma B factor antagonist